MIGSLQWSPMASTHVRRCDPADWRAVRRLHIRLALGLPSVVDVDLNEVLATPDEHWRDFVGGCAVDDDQALFLAESDGFTVGMGHVRLEPPRARFSMLYVESELRRQGVATALVRAQTAWVEPHPVSELVCHIPDVSAAAPLAEDLGWQRTDEVFHTRHRIEERKWIVRLDPATRPGPA